MIINGFTAGGLPPTGVGIYARAQSADWLSAFDFVCLHRSRADTPAKAAQLMDSGTRVWLYSTPSGWNPVSWRAEHEAITEMALRLGVDGFIADPENDWPQLSRSERERLGHALGAALAESAMYTRVGVTSYPMFPARRPIAEACEGRVWGSPQIYEKSGGTTLERYRENVRGYYNDWLALFGDARVIPSVSAWPSSRSGRSGDSRIGNASDYRNYLENVPPAVGAIGWPTNSAPGFYREEMLRWSPGGPLVYLRAAGSWLTSPVGIGFALFAIVALAALGGAGAATIGIR